MISFLHFQNNSISRLDMQAQILLSGCFAMAGNQLNTYYCVSSCFQQKTNLQRGRASLAKFSS